MLTDRQIAVLRDIGPASSFDQAKKEDVLDLLARGYIERDGDLCKLTAIGLKELLDRPRG
jgi:hypothetical protein